MQTCSKFVHTKLQSSHQIIQKEVNILTYRFERAAVDGPLEPFVVLIHEAMV